MVPEGATWNVAFGLVAVVMTISLLTFVYTKYYGHYWFIAAA